MSRSKSSKRWLQEHHQDEYVLKARAQGYRSRAVFKLAEIQQKDRVLKPGQFVLDLGAAPGGWSEYASQILGDQVKIIAVDLLPIESIAGVTFLQGDFTEQETLDRLLELAGDQLFDLVLSDMAPNISGIRTSDQARTMALVALADEAAEKWLKPGGTLVVKIFQGEGIDDWIREIRTRFGKFKQVKPEASRPDSREMYAVAQRFQAGA
jgi:23S rRNA (uridine2552-2'-O)-methyltransferase